MNMPSVLPQLLMSIGSQAPVVAVWVVGAVLAVTFWKRDPRGSVLVLLACIISIVDVFVFGAVYVVLPRMLSGTMTLGGFGIGAVFTALGLVRACLTGLTWTLVLVAVFRRSPVA